MNLTDMFIWREALASCAIEGNQYAIEMLELYKTDRDKFLLEMYKFHERFETLEKGENNEGIPKTHNKKKSTRKSR